MKKLLFLLIMTAAFNCANAFTTDTTLVNPIVVQINPVVTNAISKDTVIQIVWCAFEISKDTSIGCNSYVQFFDSHGRIRLTATSLLPASIARQLGAGNNAVSDFILNKYGLVRRQQ